MVPGTRLLVVPLWFYLLLATEGDVWYDTDNGRSYVDEKAMASSQWVEELAWDGGTPDTIGTTELVDESVPQELATGGLTTWTAPVLARRGRQHTTEASSSQPVSSLGTCSR